MLSVLKLVDTTGKDFAAHMFTDDIKEVWLVVSTNALVTEHYVSMVQRRMISASTAYSQISWYVRDLFIYIESI